MTTPGKKYYKLNEQTGKYWPRTTEDDILAWCIAGHFPLYVYWEGVYGARGSLSKDGKAQVSEDGLTEAEFFHDGLYAELPTPVIERMLYENENPVRDTLFFVPGKDMDYYSGYWKNREFVDREYTVYKHQLLISGDDVRRMEAEHPGLLGGDDTPDNPVKTKIDAPAKTRTDQRIEDTNLHIIGTLLKILNGETGFESEALIIDAITDRYNKVFGLSKRTLEDRFSRAKKALEKAIRD